jgi:hypothetical protein
MIARWPDGSRTSRVRAAARARGPAAAPAACGCALRPDGEADQAPDVTRLSVRWRAWSCVGSARRAAVMRLLRAVATPLWEAERKRRDTAIRGIGSGPFPAHPGRGARVCGVSSPTWCWTWESSPPAAGYAPGSALHRRRSPRLGPGSQVIVAGRSARFRVQLHQRTKTEIIMGAEPSSGGIGASGSTRGRPDGRGGWRPPGAFRSSPGSCVVAGLACPDRRGGNRRVEPT